MLILFQHKKKSYRMRVAKAHKHAGEQDCIEVLGKDMLGAESWSPLPDGPAETPCSEWLIKRALWHTLEKEPLRGTVNLVTIDIGEV